MNDDLKQVNDQLQTLRRKQMALEAAEFKERLRPLIEKAIGKTYAYRGNSYSTSEKWDEFRKLLVVSFSQYHAWMVFEQCAVRHDGSAKIETVADLVSSADGRFPKLESNWTECDESEYEANRVAVIIALSRPDRFIKSLSAR